ncbi:hypothetical protein GCM10018962_77380 [Dactylosporangium matsuzakiense]|uniref:hypothetical protein n=1 Tax=Dactylosporangium matsuzakiense TaxID=53360 RepID=UPI0031E67368
MITSWDQVKPGDVITYRVLGVKAKRNMRVTHVDPDGFGGANEYASVRGVVLTKAGQPHKQLNSSWTHKGERHESIALADVEHVDSAERLPTPAPLLDPAGVAAVLEQAPGDAPIVLWQGDTAELTGQVDMAEVLAEAVAEDAERLAAEQAEHADHEQHALCAEHPRSEVHRYPYGWDHTDAVTCVRPRPKPGTQACACLWDLKTAARAAYPLVRIMSCPRGCGVDVAEHASTDLVDGRCDLGQPRSANAIIDAHEAHTPPGAAYCEDPWCVYYVTPGRRAQLDQPTGAQGQLEQADQDHGGCNSGPGWPFLARAPHDAFRELAERAAADAGPLPRVLELAPTADPALAGHDPDAADRAAVAGRVFARTHGVELEPESTRIRMVRARVGSRVFTVHAEGGTPVAIAYEFHGGWRVLPVLPAGACTCGDRCPDCSQPTGTEYPSGCEGCSAHVNECIGEMPDAWYDTHPKLRAVLDLVEELERAGR